MKKRWIIYLLVITLLISGCASKDARTFKKEYETLNDTGDFRRVKIPTNNPIKYANAHDIVKMIEEEKTFYVYFGSSYCPWCRSVIENFLDVAKDYDIEEVYYVDIWEGNHVEILRDVYDVNDQKELELVQEGSEDYYKLLQYFDAYLEPYIIDEIDTGEKRLTVPAFLAIDKGVVKAGTSGISPKQDGALGELTEDVLADEEEKFKEFFK